MEINGDLLLSDIAGGPLSLRLFGALLMKIPGGPLLITVAGGPVHTCRLVGTFCPPVIGRGPA